MADQLEKFIAEASSIRLTPEEKAQTLMSIKSHMAEGFVRNTEDARQLTHMEDALSSAEMKAVHSLKKDEHTKLRQSLVDFMNEHPAAALEETYEKTSFAEYFFMLIKGVVPRTLVLACLFLMVGSGVAMAAESSMPGDWLYPFKVQVVERVRTGLAFTPNQKAQWEAKKALRRLEEAESMAAQNDLTTEAWAGLHGNFVQHVEDVKKQIGELSKTDAAGAQKLSEDLDSYLKAHEAVIQVIGSERRNNPEIETVLENVREVQTGLRAKEQDPETLTPTEAARIADHTQENAALALKEALEMITPLRADRAMNDRPAAKSKLIDAEAMLQEADAQYTAGLFDEALALARKAQGLSRETTLLLRLPVDLPGASQSSSSEESGSSESTHNAASSSEETEVQSESSADDLTEILNDTDVLDVAPDLGL